jgi:diguanylate cyclase (GGDEF)-like protein
MALALVDLDFFKKVNDTFGHEAGDAVLVAVSKALQKDRRALDTVARLGGEELALLLPSTTMEGAREVAERVRARIEALEVATAAGLIRVTASFGVAIYRSRVGDHGEMFDRADRALYAAKRAGRNRVELAPG